MDDEIIEFSNEYDRYTYELLHSDSVDRFSNYWDKIYWKHRKPNEVWFMKGSIDFSEERGKLFNRTDQKDILYLLYSPLTELFKIGVTAGDVDNRINTIQQSSGLFLLTAAWGMNEVNYDPPATTYEAALHEYFKEHRQCGEWFKLTFEQAYDVHLFIMTECSLWDEENMEELYNLMKDKEYANSWLAERDRKAKRNKFNYK